MGKEGDVTTNKGTGVRAQRGRIPDAFARAHITRGTIRTHANDRPRPRPRIRPNVRPLSNCSNSLSLLSTLRSTLHSPQQGTLHFCVPLMSVSVRFLFEFLALSTS